VIEDVGCGQLRADLSQKLISGWTVSGVETMQSGLPFTPQLGFNPTNNGDSRNTIRPSWNPAFTGPIVLGGPNQYFNPNAFILPPTATYGNVGRDVLYGFELAATDRHSPRIRRYRRSCGFNFALSSSMYSTTLISAAGSGAAGTGDRAFARIWLSFAATPSVSFVVGSQ
jgi:hypothetical protein